MAATLEASIQEALFAKVAALALSPALPVAWPNKAFTPPADQRYLRVQFVSNTATQITIGDAGWNRYLGLLQVTVSWSLGAGAAQPNEIAGQVAAHFKRGTDLFVGALVVTCYRPPEVRPMQVETASISIPVMVFWRCDAPNP